MKECLIFKIRNDISKKRTKEVKKIAKWLRSPLASRLDDIDVLMGGYSPRNGN